MTSQIRKDFDPMTPEQEIASLRARILQLEGALRRVQGTFQILSPEITYKIIAETLLSSQPIESVKRAGEALQYWLDRNPESNVGREALEALRKDRLI